LRFAYQGGRAGIIRPVRIIPGLTDKCIIKDTG